MNIIGRITLTQHLSFLMVKVTLRAHIILYDVIQSVLNDSNGTSYFIEKIFFFIFTSLARQIYCMLKQSK